MTTYTIDIEGDVLKVGFTAQQATGDVIVRDAVARLDEMIKCGELREGELIKINGRTPVLVAQVLADKLSSLYKTIAFFDPKIGDKGLDRYVVTISKNPQYKPGDILEIRREEKTPNIKVAICGFANTGKTCFREGLKKALSEIPNAPKSYFLSACPDGDGSWFSETAKCDSELANKLKAEYKTKFTEEFARFKAQEIRGINEQIFVFDVGGKISKENKIIMAEASHAVILVKDNSEILIWEDFCKFLCLQVIAIIFSDYDGKEDFIESEAPVLKGRIHCLKRGEDASGREIIKALAKVLVSIYRG
jgi:CRISPR-associated protein Csx3